MIFLHVFRKKWQKSLVIKELSVPLHRINNMENKIEQ